MEVAVLLNHHVGVKEEEPIGPLPVGQFHELRTVVADVDPRPSFEVPVDPGKGLLDALAGVVAGPGVHDDPRVDVRDREGKTALDDRRLVLDDHGQADLRTHPPANDEIRW